MGIEKSWGESSPEQRGDHKIPQVDTGEVDGGHVGRQVLALVFPTTSLRGKSKLLQSPLFSEKAGQMSQ